MKVFLLFCFLICLVSCSTVLDYKKYAGQTVMCVVAHPDDIETVAAGLMALLRMQGTNVVYVITTNGNKGWGKNRNMTSQHLSYIREEEQNNAGAVLNISSSNIIQLDFEDSGLSQAPHYEVKVKLVAQIRKFRPVALFTWKPYIDFDLYQFGLVHTDHQTTGQRILDCVYPSARDFLAFPELLQGGLEPWKVLDVYLFQFTNVDMYVDISSVIELKIKALSMHYSQYSNYTAMAQSVYSLAEFVAQNTNAPSLKYAEGYHFVPMLP